jgi:probable rRNA maturation factor
VELAFKTKIEAAEISLRTVSIAEMSLLNQEYRQKSGPTNVLSFPSSLPEAIQKQLEQPHLGDLVICPEVLAKEALEQQKELDAHWAHIVIHGALHLLGHDHMHAEEEKIMQACEINLLQTLNIANPYD